MRMQPSLLAILVVAAISSPAWSQNQPGNQPDQQAVAPAQSQADEQAQPDRRQESQEQRHQRVQKLLEQMRDIQRELAREGIGGPGAAGGFAPGALGAGGQPQAALGQGEPGRGQDRSRGARRRDRQRRGGNDIQDQLGDMERLIDAQSQKVELLARLHGDDSEQVRKATDELQEMNERHEALQAELGASGGGQPGLPPPQTTQQYRRMIQAARAASGLPGGNFPHGLAAAGLGPGALGPGTMDQAQMGHHMIIDGLEMQLQSQAAAVRAARDEESKTRLTEDLREMVEHAVEARQVQTQREIKRLEKHLAELKKQADEPESSEQLIQRLLAESQDAQPAQPEQPEQVEPQQAEAAEQVEEVTEALQP